MEALRPKPHHFSSNSATRGGDRRNFPEPWRFSPKDVQTAPPAETLIARIAWVVNSKGLETHLLNTYCSVRATNRSIHSELTFRSS